MKSTKQKTPTKTQLDTKIVEKHVWNIATAIADQINTSIVGAARANKLQLAEKDVSVIVAIVKAAAENAASGATRTLITSLQK